MADEREEAYKRWLEGLPVTEDGFIIIGDSLVMPTEEDLLESRKAFQAGFDAGRGQGT